MVAFYGCLLAEVVPVPIEVPLSRKVLNEIRHVFHIKEVPLCHLAVLHHKLNTFLLLIFSHRCSSQSL